jgi:hypothetical protein
MKLAKPEYAIKRAMNFVAKALKFITSAKEEMSKAENMVKEKVTFTPKSKKKPGRKKKG